MPALPPSPADRAGAAPADGRAPRSRQEAARLALLGECRILDTPPDADFDDLTRLAAQICGTPIALISLLDAERQWFKSRQGLEATETPRRLAFCGHAILDPAHLLVVPDATRDARFSTNELVTGPPGIRFYAGAPLVLEGGLALGTLCVIDTRPRELDEAQREGLAALARQVVSQIQLRRQNRALEQARGELQGFFSLPLDMLCVAGTDGYFKVLNPAFSETLGYTTAELLASSFLDFIHPDDVARTLAEVERLGEGRATVDFENRYRHKDGSYRWLSWKCAPGKDGRLHASARDVTEGKRLSELQSGILQSAAYAVIATTTEGIITEFNPAAQRLLGYSAEEMVGRVTPAVFHDPAEVAARAVELSAELGQVIEPGFEVFVAQSRRGLPSEHEWTYLRKDGTRVPIQLSITALHDGPERIVGFLGLAIDITERKRAEAQLIASEKRFREAIEYSAIGMALVGLDGSWLKVNRALCTIVGRSEPELRRCTFQDITHPDDLNADLANVQALLAGEIDHYQMQKRYFHQQGHIVWVLLAVTLVRDGEGQPVHFVSQIEDITERREAERRLKASLEEKETLLKEVHHRVKNNLQVVTSLLQLQSNNIAEPALLALFREAQDRVRAMALIHEGLYRSGNLAAVDFGAHVRELAAVLLRSYGSSAAPVRLEAATQSVQLDIDLAVPLSLIVNELVTNAFKHAFAGGRGGVLRLDFRVREDGQLQLSVGDDGPGLAEDFDLEKTPSLGLKIVRILTRQIGGQLEVQRRPSALFTLTFPRSRSV